MTFFLGFSSFVGAMSETCLDLFAVYNVLRQLRDRYLS